MNAPTLMPSVRDAFAIDDAIRLIVSTAARAGTPIRVNDVATSIGRSYPQSDPTELAAIIMEMSRLAGVEVASAAKPNQGRVHAATALTR